MLVCTPQGQTFSKFAGPTFGPKLASGVTSTFTADSQFGLILSTRETPAPAVLADMPIFSSGLQLPAGATLLLSAELKVEPATWVKSVLDWPSATPLPKVTAMANVSPNQVMLVGLLDFKQKRTAPDGKRGTWSL